MQGIVNEPKMGFDEYQKIKIEELELEVSSLHRVIEFYQKQLEQTVEFNSVEKYRETIKRNNQ